MSRRAFSEIRSPRGDYNDSDNEQNLPKLKKSSDRIIAYSECEKVKDMRRRPSAVDNNYISSIPRDIIIFVDKENPDMLMCYTTENLLNQLSLALYGKQDQKDENLFHKEKVWDSVRLDQKAIVHSMENNAISGKDFFISKAYKKNRNTENEIKNGFIVTRIGNYYISAVSLYYMLCDNMRANTYILTDPIECLVGKTLNTSSRVPVYRVSPIKREYLFRNLHTVPYDIEGDNILNEDGSIYDIPEDNYGKDINMTDEGLDIKDPYFNVYDMDDSGYLPPPRATRDVDSSYDKYEQESFERAMEKIGSRMDDLDVDDNGDEDGDEDM